MEADDPFVRQRNEYVAGKLEEQLEVKIQERIRAAESEAHDKAVEACAQAVINLGLRSDGSPRGQDIVLGAIRRLKREPKP